MNRQPKFGAIVPVANDFRFVPAVVGQLLKVCDRILLLRSTRSFSGAPFELYPAPPLDPRVEIVEQRWIDEGATRNAGIEILAKAGYDYIFTIDADEIFTTAALEVIKQEAARGHRAIACYMNTYWKSTRFEIWPPERICATVVVHKDVRFRFMRVIEGEPHILKQRLMQHLSYVRTDEEIKEKLRLYAHADQIKKEDVWYDKIWKAWDDNRELLNLNPIVPSSFRIARPVVCEELEAVLKEHGVE